MGDSKESTRFVYEVVIRSIELFGLTLETFRGVPNLSQGKQGSSTLFTMPVITNWCEQKPWLRMPSWLLMQLLLGSGTKRIMLPLLVEKRVQSCQKPKKRLSIRNVHAKQ